MVGKLKDSAIVQMDIYNLAAELDEYVEGDQCNDIRGIMNIYLNLLY